MSRIGNLPINIPKGVEVNINDKNLVTVKGALGILEQKVDSCIKFEESNNQIIVKRETDQKRHKALHGLHRSLVANMIEGVSKGFEIKLEIIGVGYKVSNKGQLLELSLGYSHDICLELPKEVKVETLTEKSKYPLITLKSCDKQLIGLVASKIRSFRPPEPYKGKGIKYSDEHIRRKAGKMASSAGA